MFWLPDLACVFDQGQVTKNYDILVMYLIYFNYSNNLSLLINFIPVKVSFHHTIQPFFFTNKIDLHMLHIERYKALRWLIYIYQRTKF